MTRRAMAAHGLHALFTRTVTLPGRVSHKPRLSSHYLIPLLRILLVIEKHWQEYITPYYGLVPT